MHSFEYLSHRTSQDNPGSAAVTKDSQEARRLKAQRFVYWIPPNGYLGLAGSPQCLSHSGAGADGTSPV